MGRGWRRGVVFWLGGKGGCGMLGYNFGAVWLKNEGAGWGLVMHWWLSGKRLNYKEWVCHIVWLYFLRAHNDCLSLFCSPPMGHIVRCGIHLKCLYCGVLHLKIKMLHCNSDSFVLTWVSHVSCETSTTQFAVLLSLCHYMFCFVLFNKPLVSYSTR